MSDITAVKFQIVPPSCTNGFLYDGEGNQDNVASAACSCTSLGTNSITCCYNSGAKNLSTCTETSGGTETACSCALDNGTSGFSQYCLGSTTGKWNTPWHCDGTASGSVVYMSSSTKCVGDDVFCGYTTDNTGVVNDLAACLAPDLMQCFFDYSTGAPATATLYLDTEVSPNPSWNTRGFDGPSSGVIGGYINCTFSPESFYTVDQINYWKTLFLPPTPTTTSVPNQDVWNANWAAYSTIMSNFCGRPVEPKNPDDQGCQLGSIATIPITTNVCPVKSGLPLDQAMKGNPDGVGNSTGNGLTGCSRFNAIGPAGELCTGWLNQAKCIGDTGTVDTVIKSYCGTYNCSNDCLCTNASIVDPNFQAIYNSASESSIVVQDYACWYLPCQSPYNLVSTQMESLTLGTICSQTGGTSTCTAQVCEDVQNIVNNTGTVNTSSNSNISCNFASGGSTSQPGTFWDKYGIYILIGIGVAVLVIIIIAAIFIFRGK